MTTLVLQPIQKTKTENNQKKTTLEYETITHEKCCQEDNLEFGITYHHSRINSKPEELNYGYISKYEDDCYETSHQYEIPKPNYCHNCGTKHNVSILPGKHFEHIYETKTEQIEEPIIRTRSVTKILRDEWIEKPSED